MASRTRLSFPAILSVAMSASTMAQGVKMDQLSPQVREYCHIVSFDRGWGGIPSVGIISFDYDYRDKYEFRVLGLLSTTFLVRGRSGIVSDRGDAILEPTDGYTRRIYEIDLADPKARAHLVPEAMWLSAARIPFVQESIVSDQMQVSGEAEFNGMRLLKTGTRLMLPRYASRLSPDRTWLVLQSWSGKINSESSLAGQLGAAGVGRGQLFFDVFHADTGKRVVTIEGRFQFDEPESTVGTTGWVTERYFVVPLGAHRERCLVCDFGGRGREQTK
jgi:hypothetical protein